MSDYTPTTDIIHACYLACTNWEFYEGKSVSEVSKEVDAQFDRWLAEVKALERERVIKSLEVWITPCETPDNYDKGFEAGVKEAIEYIKGVEQ